MEASTREGGQGAADQAKEKASDVADQAKERASEAADQARERAGDLASQARDRARTQIDDRSTQAGEKVQGTAQDLRSVGEELRNQGKEGPAKIADQAADRIERAGSYLRDSDADRLLHDVEDFGRRRPWAVLAGGLIAGIAAARVMKASARDRYAERSGSRGQSFAYTPGGHDGDSGVSVYDEPTRPVETAGVR